MCIALGTLCIAHYAGRERVRQQQQLSLMLVILTLSVHEWQGRQHVHASAKVSAKRMRVCSRPGCGALTRQGMCDTCKRESESKRGSSTQRGYGAGHTTFRRAVLAKHPVCVLCRRAPSRVADHWPLSRRELVAAGRNPNDPRYGRGLCTPCDSAQTARRQPGGWNRRMQ